MTHDESLVRRLAEKVMGWPIIALAVWTRNPVVGVLVACEDDGLYFVKERGSASQRFDPLSKDERQAWADAGMVWERAQETGVRIEVAAVPSGPHAGWSSWARGALSSTGYASGPRAICEAVAGATGWKWKEK